MKKIFKLSSLALLMFLGVSCSEDDQMIATPSGGPELLNPESGAAYVLSPENASSDLVTLVWDHADYSVQTVVNYELEVALSGSDFASPISAGTTVNRYYTWKVEDLNNVAVAAGLSPFTAGDIDVRLKSTLGSNQGMSAYSNVITLTITPYSTDLPKLAVPGNHQGWSDANNFESAPRIAASAYGATDYEGYLWLDGEFKFLAPNGSGAFAWGNTDWGDDGSFSDVLVVTGESNCNATSGFYRVRANTGTLTYSAAAVSWGIIGAATPTGWDSDTDLTYNPTTKKLEIASIALVPGAFKFRGNNAWSNGFDLGTVNADGYLVDGGDLTFSGPAGNYKVILDLSNPRRYTYTLIAL
jgi:hypothetical protein